MDKKRVIIFSSLILSLFLIGIFLAQGVNTIETTTNKVGLNTSGENNGGAVALGLRNITAIDKWSHGISAFADLNRTEIFNITLNWTGFYQNITSINITIPTTQYEIVKLDPQINRNGSTTNFNWSIYNTSNTLVYVINTSLGSFTFNDTAGV